MRSDIVRIETLSATVTSSSARFHAIMNMSSLESYRKDTSAALSQNTSLILFKFAYSNGPQQWHLGIYHLILSLPTADSILQVYRDPL